MRHPLRSLGIAAVSLSLLAAACGDDDPGPGTSPTQPTVAPTTDPVASPTAPVAFTTGQAHVEITGDENVTFDAQLDPQNLNEFDPEDGNLDLEYRGGDDGLLRMTLTFEGPQLTDSFIAIGLGGELAGDENYYYDAFHTQCEVTTEPFTGTSVSGSFTCTELPEESGATINATGTFTASAA